MRNRRLAIVFAIVLVNQLSFGIVIPLLPYLAGEIGASPLQVGLLTAAYPLAQLVGAPVLGRLSDRFGRKPVLLLSILGTVAGFVVLALARALPLLFIGRLVDGLTGGNISVAQAYIADVTDRAERGRGLGLIGAAFGLGFVVGPVTGGLLSGISYTAPAWVGAALAALNLLFVLAFLPESLSGAARERLAGLKRSVFDVAAIRHALTHPRVGPILTVRAVTGVAFAMFETTLTLWAIAALALTARETGAVLGFLGIVSVIIQATLIGRLTKRFADDWLLMTAVGVSAACLLLWAVTPSALLLAALIVPLAFGLAVGQTTMTSALSKAVPRDEVGSVLGVQTSVMSLARVVAPVIGAFLLDSVATWAPGLAAGALTLAVMPYAWKALCLVPGRSSCEIAVDDD